MQRLCLVMIATLCFTACSPKPEKSVRIAINPWPGYELLYLAEQKGFFEEVGANIQLVQISSLQDGQRAYIGGRVDGICSTIIEVLQADLSSSEALKIVLVADYSNGGDVIMANSSIGSLEGLAGKKIGAEITSLGIFVLHKALETVGLSVDDVSVRNVEQLNGEQALLSGEIDAFVTYPPVSTSISKHDSMHQLFSSAEIPNQVIDVVAVSERVLQEKPELVGQIRAAWQLAMDYAKDHPDDAYQIMAEREGISAEEFAEALEGIVLLSEKDQAQFFTEPENLQASINAACKTLRRVGALAEDCNNLRDLVLKE